MSIDLSVVIVTYNAADTIVDCIQSVLDHVGDLSCQILAVDSASRDDTVKIITERFTKVDLTVAKENLGFSAGNNLAFEKCEGRHVILLNPDTIVYEGSLPAMVKYLDEHESCGAVGPRLLLKDGRIQPECARPLPKLSNMMQWLLPLDKLHWKIRYRNEFIETGRVPPRPQCLDGFNLLFWDREESCEVEFVCGAALMVRGSLLKQIGGLDETSPMYLDDIDFCRRVRKAGFHVYYLASVKITHLWEQSTSSLNRVGDFYALQCHSIWYYFKKHEGVAASFVFCLYLWVAMTFRLTLNVPLIVLTGGDRKFSAKRRFLMGLGMLRWLTRIPKRAPRFGFAYETAGKGSQA